MKNFQFRFILSVISLFSILMMATTGFAAPVRLSQVVEIVNAKPGRASTGGFSQLRLVNGYIVFSDDGDDKDKVTPPQQDDRVIRETKTEIVEDTENCDCEEPPRKKNPPYWLLAFAAIPLLFLIPHDKDKTPTPTRTPPTTGTPTMTPTPTETPTTPTPTPTTTPTTTPTKTPKLTPTPPEPVPEPMTLLLFGTGLAGIGVAARKRFGKKKDSETKE
jgi:hypothetical protein